MEFQLKLEENLILKYHRTEVRPSGRSSKTAPPTRINAPHYPSYSFKAKSMLTVCCVTKWVSVMKQGTGVKIAMWLCVLYLIFSVIIPWSVTKRVKVESDRIK
jgi:hypothetical protein